MKFAVIPTAEIDHYFPKCVALVQKALDCSGGDMTAHYLFQQCRIGRAFLYVDIPEAIKNVAVFQFEDWKGKCVVRVLTLSATGGGGNDWAESIRQLAEYCEPFSNKIVFYGREGWKRRLPGVRVKSVEYELEI